MKLLLLLFITASLTGCYSVDPQKTGKEGQPMPDFNMLLTDSITWINPNQKHTNNPIALFYFSPYCPYCNTQTKEILEDMDRLKEIQFYLVSRFPMSSIKEFQ